MTATGECQVQVSTWPLVGSIFDIYNVIDRETLLPKGWTCVSCVTVGDDQGLTFAHVTLEAKGENAFCDRIVTVVPIIEESENVADGVEVVEELPEMLLQVVAKDLSDKSGSPNFLVTQIKSVADVVDILDDEKTYRPDAHRDDDDRDDDDREDDDDDEKRDGETIEIEEEVQEEEEEEREEEEEKSDEEEAEKEMEASRESQSSLEKGEKTKKRVAKKSTGMKRTVEKEAEEHLSDASSQKKRAKIASSSSLSSSSEDAHAKPKNGFVDPNRPFQCMECESSFKYRNHFKDHLRVHTDDTFECPICRFETKAQSLFTTHMTKHGSGQYSCSDHGTSCKKVFNRLHDLARHLPKDHGIDTGFKLHHFDPEKDRMKEKQIKRVMKWATSMSKRSPKSAVRGRSRAPATSRSKSSSGDDDDDHEASRRNRRSSAGVSKKAPTRSPNGTYASRERGKVMSRRRGGPQARDSDRKLEAKRRSDVRTSSSSESSEDDDDEDYDDTTTTKSSKRSVPPGAPQRSRSPSAAVPATLIKASDLPRNSAAADAASACAASPVQSSSPPQTRGVPFRPLNRPAGTEPSAREGDAEDSDIPDPAELWLRHYRLGCDECGVPDFGSDSQFVQHHLEKHSDDRPYKCQNLEKDHATPKKDKNCTSSFRQRHHYKEHIRGVHNPEIKHFKCKLCPKRYSTRTGLTNHSATHHSAFKCPTCDAGFNKDTALQKHMVELNHFGDVADRSSFDEEELRRSLDEMARSIGRAPPPPFPATSSTASSLFRRSRGGKASYRGFRVGVVGRGRASSAPPPLIPFAASLGKRMPFGRGFPATGRGAAAVRKPRPFLGTPFRRQGNVAPIKKKLESEDIEEVVLD